MHIVPYQQSLSNSCLAASLLMVSGKKVTPKLEESVCIRGSKRRYDLYVVGVPFEFCLQTRQKLSVYVDNRFFANLLAKQFAQNRLVSVTHRKVDLKLLRELSAERPIVCHIDDHFLGDYSHCSHFVVVEKISKSMATLIDPYYGKRSRISCKTLVRAIASLKQHIRMCPLIFQVDG